MFSILPACPNTQDHAPAAQVIQRRSLASQQRWVTKRERRNQRPKVDALCMVSQIGERNDHFQRIFIRRACIREVIGPEKSCKAQIFYFLDELFPMRPGEAVLSLNLYRYIDHARA